MAVAIATASCAGGNSFAGAAGPVTTIAPGTIVESSTIAPGTIVEPAPPASTGGPWLAIQVYTVRRWELRVLDQAGVEISAPASDIKGSHQTNPDWSPDGTMLTFGMADANDGRDDLWVVGADGSNPQMVFDCADDCEYIDDPAWSRDGSSIAVCRLASVDGADVGTLALVDVATGSMTEIAALEANDFCAGPRWSPDGAAIVAEVVHRSGATMNDDVTGVTLSIIEVATGKIVTSLTDPELFAATADWSPATDEIVYSALPTPTATAPELFSIRPDGSGFRQLTNLTADGGSASEPTVSPDGSTVVFVGAGVLLSLDLATGEIAPASTPPVVASHPRFVPLGAGS